MATVGLAGDVNNAIFMTSAYPYGRSYGMVPNSGSDFSMRNNYPGEIGGLNQDFRYGGASFASTAVNPNMPAGSHRAPMNGNGGAQTTPAHHAAWFIGIVLFVIAFAWLARRYAPDGEQFALIKPNIFNFIFMLGFIIIGFVLLKQTAHRFKDSRFAPLKAGAELILSA